MIGICENICPINYINSYLKSNTFSVQIKVKEVIMLRYLCDFIAN